MVIKQRGPRVAGGVRRASIAFDPIDLDLLDRLGQLEGLNRSEELRSLLLQLRPMLKATVDALESAVAQRDRFDQAAAEMAIEDLSALLPELEKMSRTYLGAMSRIEGAQAAAAPEDPRPSNTGVTPPPPTNPTDKD